MDITVQYTIIFLLFTVAILTLVRRLLPKKKNNGKCKEDCKCKG